MSATPPLVLIEADWFVLPPGQDAAGGSWLGRTLPEALHAAADRLQAATDTPTAAAALNIVERNLSTGPRTVHSWFGTVAEVLAEIALAQANLRP